VRHDAISDSERVKVRERLTRSVTRYTVDFVIFFEEKTREISAVLP